MRTGAPTARGAERVESLTAVVREPGRLLVLEVGVLVVGLTRVDVDEGIV